MKSSKIFNLRSLALLFVSALLNATVMHAAEGAIRLEPVLQGLSSPVYITNAHDGSNRLFVVEQPGRIQVLAAGASAPSLFLDITSKVLFGGERGLLGLAFHPQFATNSRFFVNYTRQTDGATVIAEYHVSADPNVAAVSEIILLVIPQPYANHNGGMIEFGGDGYLYIGMGDGGSANDPENRAQNIDELLGKILRIDVDNPAAPNLYSSPPGNPFAGATPGSDEIFAVGMRNPFRFSFDRETGQLYVGDVGQSALEEVDIVTVGGNYGWRVYEGTNCTGLDAALCNPANFVAPIVQYAHSGGRCSIIGGYVYRGSAATLPVGTYVFGDYCTGEIFSQPGGVSNPLLDTALNISSFGEDEAGEIYVVGLGGTVDRISPVSPTASTTTLTGPPGAAAVGTPVVFTATVSGTNPIGNVSFTESNVALTGCGVIALTGTGNSKTATCTISSLTVGSHSIVANYGGDPGNAASSSSALSQVINTAGSSSNVALASAGAGASASSTYSAGFAVAAINNNERAGANWGNGGGWNDATANQYVDDWVQINFSGAKTIDRVVVYTLQDNYTSPIEPLDTQTFTLYGITAFDVQGWNGSTWVPLATVTGNNLVKRSVTFTAFTTDRIRINITNALASYSRLTEIEAYGTVGDGNLVPVVSLTAPANNATYTAPALVTINADASDSDGSISHVEFYWGATLLGQSLATPYSFSWTNVPAGSYSLTAKAYDNAGAFTVSAPVTITVNPSSSVSTAPDRPVVTQNGSSILVSWNAVQGATGYAVYAAYNTSPAGIYRTYLSPSSWINIPVTDFPSQKSLYFSVAAIVNGQELEKSHWAYLLSFDDVDLGFWGAITIGDFNNDGCAEVLGTLNDCNGNLIPRPEVDLGLSALRAPGRSYRDARMADFNGDGLPDLIANVYSSISDTGSTTLLFYGRGDGTFVLATPDQFPAIYRGYGETIVVADFDNDGYLDIFLPNYTHSSSQEQNYLLRNQGNGTFVEIADIAGVANREWPLTLKVEGAQALDINGDGFLDIYSGSHLYINNGDMTFTDRRQEYGLPLNFDEGAKFFDWNNDGYIDLVLQHPDNGPTLFQFDGHSFTRIDDVFPTRYYNGAFGLNAEDVDGDGFLDVIVGGGFESDGSNKRQTLFLKRQDGYIIFDLGPGTGMWSDIVGFADIDANGTIDVILRSGNLHYLKNTASDSSTIKVSMYGESGVQNQHGRTIRATPQNDPGFTMTRIVDGGSGYLSNSEYPVTFPTPKGDWYWIGAQFDTGIVGGWANAGSIVKIYRDGQFITYPR